MFCESGGEGSWKGAGGRGNWLECIVWEKNPFSTEKKKRKKCSDHSVPWFCKSDDKYNAITK